MSADHDTRPGDFAAYGVEALIERLRDQGVAAGRREADAIIAEARQRAAAIVAEARAEAAGLVTRARAEAAALQQAGRDALGLAARDAHLKLREVLNERFSGEIRRLVGRVMEPEAFMEKLILEVAGRARQQTAVAEGGEMVLMLPEEVVGIDELRRSPEELKEGTLAHFVVSVMGSLLREGVSYQPSGDVTGGIKACLKDGGIEVDLTDEAIAALLLEHLQPRFRALLEGVIK